MKKNKKLLIGIGIVVLIGIVSVGILNRYQQTESGSGIRVGVLAFLTGTFADTAQSMVKGITLAKEEFNQQLKAGDKEIIVVVEDGKTEARASVSAVQKLLNSKVDMMILSGDNQVPAIAPIISKYHIPSIVTITANSNWLPKDDSTSWMFRYFTSSFGIAHAMADFAVNKLRLESCAVLYLNGEYGLDGLNGFSSHFKNLGGKILSAEPFQEESVDARPAISKIISNKPQAIYVVGYGNGYYAAINQLRELRYGGTILTCEHISSPESKEKIKNLAGIYFVTQRIEGSERYLRFANKYSSRFGKKPDIYAAYGYDSMNIILQAYQKVGNNPYDIQKCLSKVVDFPAVLGDVSLTPKGECLIALDYAVMKQDGNYEIVK